MDRKREKEGGRIQCFMKNEDRSLIDVEICRNYLFRQLCFLRGIGLLFVSFVSSISVLLLTHSVKPSYLVVFIVLSQSQATFPELGPDETFQSSSRAGVTNDNPK